MAILCLLKNYNNYSNRIVKRSDFSDLVNYDYVIQKNINFNPNDGVNTEQIINWSEEWLPNYLVILSKDPGESEGEDPVILQRWFVTDTDRTRKGQYHLVLRSDLIVENYENILEAPMIINRGMVNHNNPLVFNDEGFSFNEIKVEERLLVDSQNMFPYIVLYCAKNMADKNNIPVKSEWTPKADVVLNTTIDSSIYAAGSYASLAQESYVNFWSKWVIGPTPQVSTPRRYSSLNNEFIVQQNNDNIGEIITRTETVDEVKSNLVLAINNYMPMYQNDYRLTQIGKISEAVRTSYESALNRNFVVEDVNGKFYKVTISKQISNYKKIDVDSSMAMFNDLRDNINEYYEYTPTNKSFDYYYKEYTYTVTTTLLENYSFNASVTPSTHNITNDSECNVILLPYGDIKLVYAVDPDTGVESYDYIYKDDQLTIARAIAREYTNSVIYDMQLLPYAPYQSITNGDSLYYYQLNTSEYELQSYNGEVKGILLYPSMSNFSFNLYSIFNINSYSDVQAVNYKIESNCTKHRLCSPNYNGIFEWNNAKNDGVNFFNIDITYRPYNPYIHINPNFKGIYGTDYNDARGLICQGDFSLPITGDAFAQYELNNKNYLNVFNRDIQHMDFTQKQESNAAITQAVVGTLQGATTGAAMGAMAGGGYGAVAGAVVGAVTSGVGAAVDISMLQERQREDRAYKKDMFSYQLGNIKALPYSLNKVTPLTWNNKIFPFVEVYTCTDEEKKILENRIKYDSMKLDCIDTLGNLILNYTEDNDMHFYSGSIIRLEGVDNHEAEEIYKELMKGVYL